MNRKGLHPHIRRVVFVYFIAVHGVALSNGEERVIRATGKDRILLSNDSRAYCLISNRGHVRFSKTAMSKETLRAETPYASVPGTVEQFAVSEDFDFAYCLSTKGIFLVDLRGTPRSVRTKTPVDFNPHAVNIVAVIGGKSIVRFGNMLAITSPEGFTELHKHFMVWRTRSVVRDRSILVSPGAKEDFQLIGINHSGTSAISQLGQFNAFGHPMGCQTHLRLFDANQQFSVVAGIVSNLDANDCPKGDALYVWNYVQLLDIDRGKHYVACESLAVYDDKVCLLLDTKDERGHRALVLNSFKVSKEDGLIALNRRNLQASVGGERPLLHPDLPLLILDSNSGASLRIIDLPSMP